MQLCVDIIHPAPAFPFRSKYEPSDTILASPERSSAYRSCKVGDVLILWELHGGNLSCRSWQIGSLVKAIGVVGGAGVLSVVGPILTRWM